MRVFVTGGTGFIGANLVRLLLKQGYTIRVLVRPTSKLDNLESLDVEIITGDLNEGNLKQKMQGCRALFHVAAHYSLWQADQESVYLNNVLGTRNILAAAQQAGIERTVYTSSVAAIGVGNKGITVDETHQSSVQKLVGHYKKSKYFAEQEALKAYHSGQDIVIVNPSTPIGSWDIKPTPTGEIILRFLQGKMPFYVDTGLNWIDVEDVAWGHLLALEKGQSGDRYILGNQNLTLKTILDNLSEITNLTAPEQLIPHFIPHTCAWIDEFILGAIGKKPSVSLDGVKMARQKIKPALQKAVEWFQENHQGSLF